MQCSDWHDFNTTRGTSLLLYKVFRETCTLSPLNLNRGSISLTPTNVDITMPSFRQAQRIIGTVEISGDDGIKSLSVDIKVRL